MKSTSSSDKKSPREHLLEKMILEHIMTGDIMSYQSFRKHYTDQELADAIQYLGQSEINLFQEINMTNVAAQMQKDEGLNDSILYLHSHHFYEIIFCYGGELEYLANMKRYTITKGDIIFIPPGVSHCPIYSSNASSSTEYKRYVLWVSQQGMEQIIASWKEEGLVDADVLSIDPPILSTRNTRWEFLEEIFARGCEENFKQDIGWREFVFATALQLITLILRISKSENIKRETRHELLDQIMLHIEHHLSEKITLESIASAFHVSESTISKLFKDQLNTSFYHFVTQRRLAQAKKLITSGMNMSDIAEEVGFLDYSNFYRSFKKEFHISPSDYKNLI